MVVNLGGLRRTWYTEILAKLTNPNFGLIKISINKMSLQPNPLSVIVPDYLGWFEFAGLMTAKVLIFLYWFECLTFLPFTALVNSREVPTGSSFYKIIL